MTDIFMPLYESMHSMFSAEVYPNKDENNGINFGYYIACRPLQLTEMRKYDIDISEARM